MEVERTTETWTTSDWDVPEGPPRHPVVALRVLPTCRTYLLSQLVHDNGRAKKWLLVGRGDACDIVLTERDVGRRRWRTVNRRHCLLCRTQVGRVIVKPSSDGTNYTKVNRIRIRKGTVELGPGDVLRLGKVHLVAMSRLMLDGDQPVRPNITASNPGEFFRRCTDMYGSLNKAAARFKIAASTLSGWLRDKRFNDG